ncbi:peptidoglycan-binding domain-containing protein [Streptomyces sp. NPDC012600]|uniref:peptidoglycan-binding domain-containing protein n=1 Tax=Streptomyces sp. NPDC012600 TaxID=3415005 RepID=UPI003C2DDB36
MRSNVLVKTLVSVTTAVGIAVGGLATAGTASAAPAPSEKTSVSAEVAPFAVVNLGLNTTQARNVQCFLKKYWNYTGALDGQLGTNSWKAMQRRLASNKGYTGAIDGVVGPGTISALQRLLRAYDYTGAIDGIAGPGTQAAFKRYGNNLASFC